MPDKAFTSLKEQGCQYYQKNMISEAIRCFKQYLKDAHDDNKNAHCNLSLCYFKLEQYQHSIEHCRRALDIDKAYSKVYYRLAKSYEKLGDYYNVYINLNIFKKYNLDADT